MKCTFRLSITFLQVFNYMQKKTFISKLVGIAWQRFLVLIKAKSFISRWLRNCLSKWHNEKKKKAKEKPYRHNKRFEKEIRFWGDTFLATVFNIRYLNPIMRVPQSNSCSIIYRVTYCNMCSSSYTPNLFKM